MARAAMRADNPLLLRFGEHVHGAAVAIGPVGFSDAVHQTDIEIIGAEFFSKAVEVGAHSGCVASPALREYRDLVALYVLQGLGYVRMAAIGIGGVEEAEAVVVPVQQEIR